MGQKSYTIENNTEMKQPLSDDVLSGFDLDLISQLSSDGAWDGQEVGKEEPIIAF